ncbi:ABC transporter ATP-binding protein [Elioraea rosea]|uniref:ABC transporter ATP-binding protein n=1 Tax=Elioraea rosea TaxID=2492390 RepID=UPI001182C9AB|nr:ABC transporter ATP-binding protein [Elioraea rosea]
MSELVLTSLRKTYGPTVAVDDVSLTVREGELVALLGPSGCGKTTTLRMVAGFIEPTAGQIVIGGRDVTHLPPHRRDTGMVFQSYALFPHMTVAQNVAFGLEMRNVPKAEAEKRVADALSLVRLGHLGERYPRQLSGGQQQRVALARALVVNPGVFLLDEPLSNLDAKLRLEVRVEIRELQRRLGLTTVFVTHDQEEALTLADRLVVMANGVVQQVGTPEELYESPANLFVAGFIGRSNVLAGRLVSPGRFESRGGLAVSVPADGRAAGPAALALRPERLTLAEPGAPVAPCMNSATGKLVLVTYLGATSEYRVDLRGDEVLTATLPTPPASDPLRRLAAGDPVTLTWPADACRLLAPDGAHDQGG